MTIEEVCNTPVVRLTQNFLDSIVASPKKTFSVTLGDEVYTLKVSKKRRVKT